VEMVVCEWLWVQELEFCYVGTLPTRASWDRRIDVLREYVGKSWLKCNKWAMFSVVMTSHLICVPGEPYLPKIWRTSHEYGIKSFNVSLISLLT
jgi:hypothetical protein